MKWNSLTLLVCLLSSFFATEKAWAQDPNFHIYLCFGQSNMAGAGDIEPQDMSVDSRFQFMKPQDCAAENEYAGNWYDAVPPLWGCSGGIGPSDYFGRTMVANTPSNISIGTVTVAIPGCKIELFGKTGYEGEDTYNYVPSKYNGSAYAWLLDLAKEAQKDGVIKGFLLHQGESNNGDQQWPTKVKALYDNLIADLGLNANEIPLLAGEMLYQNQGGVCWGHNSVIATLPAALPNSYVISSAGLTGKDEFHFTSAGNRTLGTRYAEQMLAIQPTGPVVSFAAPIAYNFALPATITIDASATVENGTISNIFYYINDVLVQEEWVAPYAFDWTPAEAGEYTLKAVATDSEGNTGEDVMTVVVNKTQAPYSGTPAQIPGIIQFENFDIGGNGFAYSDDSDGNTGGADFRMDEAVDIEDCTDTLAGSATAGANYNIGFATAGEWMEYTVNVETSGTYDLIIRAASDGAGKTVSLAMDGQALVEDISIPNTGGWQAWEDVPVADVELTAGAHVLRLTIGAADYVNLNYMSVTQQASPVEPILLAAGWNLIGCPIQGSIPLEDALSSVWSNVVSVKDNAEFWDKANPTPALNTLETIQFGKGYFIKVDASCELIW